MFPVFVQELIKSEIQRFELPVTISNLSSIKTHATFLFGLCYSMFHFEKKWKYTSHSQLLDHKYELPSVCVKCVKMQQSPIQQHNIKRRLTMKLRKRERKSALLKIPAHVSHPVVVQKGVSAIKLLEHGGT